MNEPTPTATPPQIWYCPHCKAMRNHENPDGVETILGIQHGETMIIKYKDLRIEVEAEGRLGINCRVCGGYVEIMSEDWEEVKKLKERLRVERSKAGPPKVETIYRH